MPTPKKPQRRYVPATITIQPTVLEFAGDNFVGTATGDPVTFTGSDAHEKAAEWLADYPDRVVEASAALNE